MDRNSIKTEIFKKIELKHAGFVIGVFLILSGWIFRLFTIVDFIDISEPAQRVINELGKTISGTGGLFLLGGIIFYAYIESKEEKNESKEQKKLVKNITPRSFTDNPIVIRPLTDNTAYVLMEKFPPDEDGNLPEETARFEKEFFQAVGAKIVREDRDRFILYSSKSEVMHKAENFLRKKLIKWCDDYVWAMLHHYFSLHNPEEAETFLLDEDLIIIWVDWREDDADIVDYVESHLQTSMLNARYESDTLIISYKDNHVVVNDLDRNNTLNALNTLLAEDYQIRLWQKFIGGDTLGFIALPNAVWLSLENTFGEDKVQAHFSKLYAGRKMF